MVKFRDIEFDENRYPMTYKEYEKRVVELFLEDYSDETLDLMQERLNEELDNEVTYIEGFYGYDCFVYDHPEIYGETAKKSFEDNFLRQTAVSNLRKIIG